MSSLLAASLASAFAGSLRLGGETDHDFWPADLRPPRGDFGQDVRIAHQPHGQFLLPRRLLDLLAGCFRRPEVGHRRCADQDIGLRQPRQDRVAHRRGGTYGHGCDAGRQRHGQRRVDQRHCGAQVTRGPGERHTHLPR